MQKNLLARKTSVTSSFQYLRNPFPENILGYIEHCFQWELLFRHAHLKCSFNSKERKSPRKNGWTHGMISVMHTYGRYMKWNPHIHALVAERVYDQVQYAS